MMKDEYKLEYLQALDIDFDKYPICQGNEDNLHRVFMLGITSTIFNHEDEPIAIVSVMLAHKGVGIAMIVPSKQAHKENRKTFISDVFRARRRLEDIAKEYQLRRIETVAIDEKMHNKFFYAMGFTPEGTKRAYGINGEDYKMWSTLWA